MLLLLLLLAAGCLLAVPLGSQSVRSSIAPFRAYRRGQASD